MVLRSYFYIEMYKLDGTVGDHRPTYNTIDKGYQKHLDMPVGKYRVCLNVTHLDSEEPLRKHQRVKCGLVDSSSCHVDFKHMQKTHIDFFVNKGAKNKTYKLEGDFVNHMSSHSIVVRSDFEVEQGPNNHLIVIPELKVVVKTDSLPTGTAINLSDINVKFKVNGLPL